jgi:hypothetical protein
MSVTRTASGLSVPNEICVGPSNELLVKRGSLVLGDTGAQFFVGPQRHVVQFDDFEGAAVAFSTTIIDGWRSRKGSDAEAVDFTVTAGTSGRVIGTIGDTTASMAVSGVQLDSGLSWKANQGDLVFETRLQISHITLISVFFGLTDQVGALEMPIQSAASANTLTTNATDAVGFMFDTSMTDDQIWLVGVANNVDATHQNSGVAPVAATDIVLRVELSAAGVATFYINGVAVGTAMTAAVTPTVALTPVLAGFNRDTGTPKTINADYVYVSANRA